MPVFNVLQKKFDKKLSGWLASLLLTFTLLTACGDNPPAPAATTAVPAVTTASLSAATLSLVAPTTVPATTALVTTAAPTTVPVETTVPATATVTTPATANVTTAVVTENVTSPPLVTTAAVAPVAGLGQINYKIDADLPADQVDIIHKGIAIAQKELGLVPAFQIEAGNSVELPVKADGTTEHDFAGFATGSGIQFLTAANAWKDAAAKDRYATVLHEYFHMVQYYLAKTADDLSSAENEVDRDGPQWVSEGSADFMAARVLERAKIYVYADWKKDAIESAVSLSVPLKGIETVTQKSKNEPGAYALGFLALDYMNTKYGNTEQNLRKYYEQIGLGTKWEDAFKKAFSISIADFYREFEAYRSQEFPAK